MDTAKEQMRNYWFLMPSRWARFKHFFGFHDWMPMCAPAKFEMLPEGPNGEWNYKMRDSYSKYPVFFVCVVCKKKTV